MSSSVDKVKMDHLTARLTEIFNENDSLEFLKSFLITTASPGAYPKVRELISSMFRKTRKHAWNKNLTR